MNPSNLSSSASYEASEPGNGRRPATRRRMGRAEFNRRIHDAPPFRHRPPTNRELVELVEEYEAIVGARTSQRVMNLLATCFRVHGPATVGRMHTLHAEIGTTNLLAELRLRPPSAFSSTAEPSEPGR